MDKSIVEGRCGNCAFWTETPMKGPVTIGEPARGFCMAVPPTPFAMIRDGRIAGVTNLRPATLANETGCMTYFMPRENFEGAPIGAIVPDAANH